jgi:hypothetical protein
MALVVANKTGATTHPQIEVTRSCMKLLFHVKVPNAELSDLYILGKGKLSVSIQGNNGAEIKIAQDVPLRELFIFSQIHEGYNSYTQTATITTLKATVDLSAAGSILLETNEKIVLTISDVNTTWVFDIFSVESSRLVKEHLQYNTVNVAAAQTQKQISGNNDEWVILPTANLNRLELNSVGTINGVPQPVLVKHEKEELASIMTDINDIEMVGVDNSGIQTITTGFSSCYVMAIDQVINYELALSGLAPYNFYTVNIATR